MAGSDPNSGASSPTTLSNPFKQAATKATLQSDATSSNPSSASYSMKSTAFAHLPSRSAGSGAHFQRGMTAIGEGSSYPRDGTVADSDRFNSHVNGVGAPAVLIRRLTRNMTEKELRSMFLFAKDFVDSEFVAPEFLEDHGYVSAIARFNTISGAHEAKAMLDGKPNTATEANMIVEVMNGSNLQSSGTLRSPHESTAHRGPSSSASSTGSSSGQAARQGSRYNGTFQTMERISPPAMAPGLGNTSNSDFPAPEGTSHLQSLFLPQSPVGNPIGERLRVSGKSVINDDSVEDDETGELLKDPVAYARNGSAAPSGPSSRRTTNPQSGLQQRFTGLSLTTGSTPQPIGQSYPASRPPLSIPSSSSALSPVSMGVLGPNSNYQMAPQHFQRPNYPPVNPADQNPPCNTLYVGNLPIDTSEDELKAMFSKQRGYKRLCFRTKQNGPMCFVEFEDVSFATKALNELYGHPLHNSVKGGIRLSFSKNPLGVRTGQPGNGHGLSSPASSHSPVPGMNGFGGAIPGQAFISANGPPPGLAAPPGLNGPTAIKGVGTPVNGSMMNGAYTGNPYAMAHNGVNGMRSPQMVGGFSNNGPSNSMHGIGGNDGSGFPEYMMGR